MTRAPLRRLFPAILVLLALRLSASADDAEGDRSRPRDATARPARQLGQRPSETDERYARRRAQMLRNTDRDNDELFTLRAKPFIVRTDISPEFTVCTALYMEMLHREYKGAYAKMGLPPGSAKEWVEVIVFADRETYKKNGGAEGSGGQFMQGFAEDRPRNWPARHYRLMMFTDGVKDFDAWPKGVLKHEAAHMELQLRLGFFVDSPRWFNEGQAACFEAWDFDLSVDDNLMRIPRRGRYAPVIRRLHGTDQFKPFSYVWQIDPASWHADMTSEQGGLNYAQAWSLAAFMLNEGVNGRKAFQQIYALSKRVGADRKVSHTGTKTRAWEEKFPRKEQEKIEQQWLAWIGDRLSRDASNDDEWQGMIDMGYDPRRDDLVRLTRETYEEVKALKDGKTPPKPDRDVASADDEPASGDSAVSEAAAPDKKPAKKKGTKKSTSKKSASKKSGSTKDSAKDKAKDKNKDSAKDPAGEWN